MDKEKNHSSNSFFEKNTSAADANRENGQRSISEKQITIPQISLPRGGGAIKSIGDKFSVNAINGTAALSLPLPVSDARGFSPALSINYNSGSGNGIFGLGWQLSLASIKRKTEKELPQYFDALDSDTFVISDAEDLVAEFKKDAEDNFLTDVDGNYIINEFTSGDDNFIIRRYCPRIEGLFARIERWTEKASGEIHWRVISKDNVTTLYGKTSSCRIADPGNPKKIFEWLIEFSYDDKGHCILYNYKQEDGQNIDADKLHNKNRLNGFSPFTNAYIKSVHYGNISPYRNHADPVPDKWMFETIFDYGEHDNNTPFDESNTWGFRPDAFSEFRAGFEIRTCRLCQRVFLVHHFSELPGGSAVIKAMNFSYTDNGEAGFTFLEKITITGFTKHDDATYTQKSLPPFSFTYQAHQWNMEVKTVSEEDLVNAPPGIDEKAYHFVDLYSEGLSGILTEQAGGWFYKSNLGEGKFTPAKLIVPKPSFNGLQNNLHLVELEANGVKQLAQWQTEPKGFFEINDEEEWQPFRAFQQIPNIDFRDPNLRLIDLNADGKADVLITEDDIFTWYPSQGKNGFDASNRVLKSYDEEQGPAIVFADKSQSIFMADMSGDGLTDIVRIRNGEICYWPNLGYGKFGAKVSMDNAPVFDHPEQFNPSFIQLADIDGSGATDVVYLGKNQFTIWLNQHGNSFLGEPKVIETFPEINNHANVSVMDLLGNGMACIVWNCDLPAHQRQPLKYIDLLDSKKPHILIAYKNNLGQEAELEYKPSTQYYIADKLKGEPWITKLHFPVHCVSKVTVYDRIMKTRFASEYSYHHGYYDHYEREFRGFGRVDQTDAEEITHFIKSGDAMNNVVEEDLHQAPVLTKTWFHTGAFLDREKMLTQFSHEYFQNSSVKENLLPDPVLPNDLNIDEWRQALRSCKGMLLRKEVYALDGDAKANLPYAVEQHNCLIKSLQPKSTNKYGVFLSHESEAITYHYERNPADPRIAHSFIFEVDKYGNVLQSASVVYSRKANPLPADEQTTTHIVLTENAFTNDILEPFDYRAPLGCFSKTYEIKGIDNPAEYFSLEDLRAKCNNAVAIDYEVIPDGSQQKRIIEFARRQYRGNDTTTALPFGTIESKALSHKTSKAAFNDAILENIFAEKIAHDTLSALLLDPTKGAYALEDGYYWIHSGTNNYDAVHFYFPTEYIDPFGNKTLAQYEANYFLFVEKVTDALSNEVSVEGFNYRTLSPYLMKDMNNNLTAVRFDELGMVVRSFAIGKKGIDNGDEFDDSKTEMKDANDFPGAEMEYDIDQWFLQSSSDGFDLNNYKPTPNYVKTRTRETHYHADPSHATKWQEVYAYSDGGGHIPLTKVQAEPGKALQINDDGSVVEIDTSPALRWIGNGRTILNNKGNPVKQYEPYFSVAPTFDDEKEMVELGVTPVIHYDPIGRVIRTDFPNGTFSQVEFDGWQQVNFDQNDTVGESKWYDERVLHPVAGIATDEEIDAAKKAFAHNNTPTIAYLDSLGRNFLTIADNVTETISTKIVFDIEGNQLEVIDALDRKVIQYQYGMLGNQLKQVSMDAGNRWMIHDVGGKPLFAWDDRNHEFRFGYDALHRPTSSFVEENGAVTLFQKAEYGESFPVSLAQSNNLLGKVSKHFDQSGITTNEKYDFKGNVLISNKRLAKDYQNKLDWTNIGAIDLREEIYESSSEYDAMNRPTRVIAPHASTIKSGEFYPSYNEANLLEKLEVIIREDANKTAFVSNIIYNEKAQRTEMYNGNNTKTAYSYERETFRLKRILTTRNTGNDILQDLNYTYDPVGNITQIVDHAQREIIFDNETVNALNKYEYDALYRLITATGREHPGQNDIDNNTRTDFNYRNFPFVNSNSVNPNDANAFRNYTEQYVYDKVGNMHQHQHVAKTSWTRTFEYSNPNNQLTKTSVGAFSFDYTYDAHGNMSLMEHLKQLSWNFKDELSAVDLGGGGQAYYVYDASGQRVRKVIERLDGSKQERIYLGAVEIYREYNSTGDTTLQRDTLHVLDDQKRIAMIDAPVIIPANSNEKQLIRYQYDNHLGSASLELDDAAQIISYEEYFPYGTTSYSTVDATREVPAKRYRYTGKERDEESGLSYHEARYYAPWLSRWSSCDPAEMVDGPNIYLYAIANPIRFIDPNGRDVDENGNFPGEQIIRYKALPNGKLFLVEGESEHAANPMERDIYNYELTGDQRFLESAAQQASKHPSPSFAFQWAWGCQGNPNCGVILSVIGGVVLDYASQSSRLPNNLPKPQGTPPAKEIEKQARNTEKILRPQVKVPDAPAKPAARAPGTPSKPVAKAPAKPAPVAQAKASPIPKPPFLSVVEIKPDTPKTVERGWEQATNRAKFTGEALSDAGNMGLATYNRETGEVYLEVRESGGMQKPLYRQKIGQLTPEQLSHFSGDTTAFGNYVEPIVSDMVTKVSGQTPHSPDKNPSANGPDWMPKQLPLPQVK